MFRSTAYSIKRACDNNDNENEVHDVHEPEEVFMEGNNIFYYGEVSRTNVSKLNKFLKILETELLKNSIGFNQKPNINLFIHSEGGCVFSGLSAMNHISTCKVDVYTIVDGFVASAATFLALAGKKRLIMPYSTVLIHQMRTEFYGKHDELKDEVENCDNIMSNFKTIYKTKTNLPEKTLNQLLKRELYLTSDKCIKYGVVDNVYE